MPFELGGGVGEEVESSTTELESFGEEGSEAVVDDRVVAETKAPMVFLSDRDAEEVLRSAIASEDGVRVLVARPCFRRDERRGSATQRLGLLSKLAPQTLK